MGQKLEKNDITTALLYSGDESEHLIVKGKRADCAGYLVTMPSGEWQLGWLDEKADVAALSSELKCEVVQL